MRWRVEYILGYSSLSVSARNDARKMVEVLGWEEGRASQEVGNEWTSPRYALSVKFTEATGTR